MNKQQRKEIIAVLLDAGRPDLVNEVTASARRHRVEGSGPDQIAATLNGIVNQVRGHLRAAGGEMHCYIRGGGSDQLDDNGRRALSSAERKLQAWEKKQLKGLADIASEVSQFG